MKAIKGRINLTLTNVVGGIRVEAACENESGEQLLHFGDWTLPPGSTFAIDPIWVVFRLRRLLDVETSFFVDPETCELREGG